MSKILSTVKVKTCIDIGLIVTGIIEVTMV